VKRGPRTASVVIALAVAIAGCGGGSATQPGGFTYENTLTVYSDLPLQGPQGGLMTSINDGEILALTQAHARGQDRNVSIALLNDAQASAGGWTEKTTSLAARAAGPDLDAIAYIGDFDSGATAFSLPIINENDILQVSPASPYVGFTDKSPLDQIGEPDYYYPAGVRTFARLVPTDLQEAAATASLMRSLGVRRVYLLADSAAVSDPYDSVIAPMLGSAAGKLGVALAGSSAIDTAAGGDYAGLAAKIAASGAGAVYVGAAPDAGAEKLWQALYAGLPGVKLFAPSTLATGPFLERLGAASGATYVTSPILPLSQYPPAAQRVLSEYRSTFQSAPTAYSLYGYEAMASVLAAIQRAHASPSRRLDVVRDYFALGERHSVIGNYRINAHGDSSLSSFAGYRVGAGGTLIELRRISGG
jgi:branched-chain amino acid transport system substrate-binding protein